MKWSEWLRKDDLAWLVLLIMAMEVLYAPAPSMKWWPLSFSLAAISIVVGVAILRHGKRTYRP